MLFQSSFRAVSEHFQSNFRAISEQFWCNSRAISKTPLVKLTRNFRAVSEQSQSSSGAVSEQFWSSSGVISEQFQSDLKAISVSEQFQSSSGAVLVPLTPTGFTAMSFTSCNNCRAIPEQFQSSSGGVFGAVSEQYDLVFRWNSGRFESYGRAVQLQCNTSALWLFKSSLGAVIKSYFRGYGKVRRNGCSWQWKRNNWRHLSSLNASFIVNCYKNEKSKAQFFEDSLRILPGFFQDSLHWINSNRSLSPLLFHFKFTQQFKSSFRAIPEQFQSK